MTGSADEAIRSPRHGPWIASLRSQRQALVNLDVDAMVAMGTHPLVPFLARMHIQRMRRS
jgi:hypothetical protein